MMELRKRWNLGGPRRHKKNGLRPFFFKIVICKYLNLKETIIYNTVQDILKFRIYANISFLL